MAQITNCDNVIDSRDIIARIEELESDKRDLIDAVSVAADERTSRASDDDAIAAHQEAMQTEADWREENNEELAALKALAKQGEDYASDWQYGATLINQEYFQEYAKELADDIGAIASDAKWPNNHIDWEAAADELKQDYTTVDFDGTTFYVR